MGEICGRYVGLACVDGSCPVANMEDIAERGMDVVRSCRDCHLYRGCEDCALVGTEYCVNHIKG